MQTTVVGNYPKIPNKPRPARLRNAINKRDRGGLTDEELEAVRNEVTIEVINEQIEAGIDIITDGQCRWDDDQTYVARNMRGVKIGALQRYLDTNTYYRETEITGDVGPASESVLARDWKFAQENSSKPVKAIVPGPFTLAVNSNDKHYNSREKLTMAFAAALRAEVDALVAAGCKHIQVNDPVIVFNKGDYGIFAKAIGKVLDGVSGAETGLYTWFGDCSGILDKMQELPVDVIGLDFRAQKNWDALKATKFTKKLGAGVIDGRNTRLEPASEVADALKRITASVPAERVYVNPSCGLEYVPRETAFDKLKVLTEAARLGEGVPA
ncbi:MAG: uroporphyrinogen decarboxylase family protein [Chloroflexota bacterium]